MQYFLDPQAWLGALVMFSARLVGMSLDTLRVLFVVRGQRLATWIFGFLQAAIYAVILGKVLSQLTNPLLIFAYGAGFATGNVLGMLIENRMGKGFLRVNIISPCLSPSLAEALRENGFAITEVPARGKDSQVGLLIACMPRSDLPIARDIIESVDPTAFITSEAIRPLYHGYWPAPFKKRG